MPLKSVEPMILCVHSTNTLAQKGKRCLAMIYFFTGRCIDALLTSKRRYILHVAYMPEYKVYEHFSFDFQQ